MQRQPEIYGRLVYDRQRDLLREADRARLVRAAMMNRRPASSGIVSLLAQIRQRLAVVRHERVAGSGSRASASPFPWGAGVARRILGRAA